MSAIALPARLPGAPVEGRGAGLEAALVDDEHPRVDDLRRPMLVPTTRFAASASSWKVRPATPVGVTIVGVDSSTSPMKPTLNFLPAVGLELLDRRRPGRASGRSRSRPRSRTGTGSRRPGRRSVVPPSASAYGRAGAARRRVAAAVLDAQQLGAALVELVVADRREVDVHQVGRDHDRLLEEEAVLQRAGADVVAGEHRRLVVAVLRLLVLDRLGEVGGATRELAVDVVRRRPRGCRAGR